MTSVTSTSTKLRIGCDPEVFIRDTATNKYVCAHGYVPGTKDKPAPLPDGMIQVDGFAVEFGIKPALTEKGFVNRIDRCLGHALQYVRQHKPTFNLAIDSIADFDPADFEAAPKEAKVLGCEPDYNAYTMQPNPRPNANGITFRTAGGHVHVGWTKNAPVDHPDHFEACAMMAKQLDVWLGLPSLFWDNDTKRRTLYGAPGAFRPKPYGMEYRSLSNKWLRHPKLIAFVYRQTYKAYERLVDGKPDYLDINVAEVFSSTNPRNRAKYYCDKLNMELPRRDPGQHLQR